MRISEPARILLNQTNWIAGQERCRHPPKLKMQRFQKFKKCCQRLIRVAPGMLPRNTFSLSPTVLELGALLSESAHASVRLDQAYNSGLPRIHTQENLRQLGHGVTVYIVIVEKCFSAPVGCSQLFMKLTQ